MPWQRIRGGLLLVVACFTNPCCAPLVVPLAIGLLAGTPAAAWLTAHLGWVYGAMTLLSVASLVIGIRWLAGRARRSDGAVDTAPRGVSAGPEAIQATHTPS